MQQAIRIRFIHGVPGAIFCERAALISMYRRFTTRHMAIISAYAAWTDIRVYVPYSPADARVKKLVRKPCPDVSPAFAAIMPNENDTAKYPKAMGKPSLNP